MKRVFFIFLFAAILCWGAVGPSAAWAQDDDSSSSASVEAGNATADAEEPEPKPGPGQTPVRIQADKMAYSDTGKTVSFFGNVKVVRDNVTLWTDKITAFFPEAGKADKIDRILAEGNVKVRMDGRTGRCRKLTYFVEDGILRMEGSPSLTEGRNTVRGAVIKFYLKDSRSEILGGRNRQVEAVFVTPKDMAP